MPPGAQVRQYALAFALAKYGTMAGPGQIAANIEVVDLAVGTRSELGVREGDKVGITYTGWLRAAADPLKVGPETEFDSNFGKDKPFVFKLGKGSVIAGWEKAIAGMQKGGKRIMVIPTTATTSTSWSYSDGSMGSIPRNSTLIFEVELVKAKFDRSRGRSDSSTEEQRVVALERAKEQQLARTAAAQAEHEAQLAAVTAQVRWRHWPRRAAALLARGVA